MFHFPPSPLLSFQTRQPPLLSRSLPSHVSFQLRLFDEEEAADVNM